MGFNLAAFTAGRRPKIKPIIIEKATATMLAATLMPIILERTILTTTSKFTPTKREMDAIQINCIVVEFDKAWR